MTNEVRPSNWEGQYWGRRGTLAQNHKAYLDADYLQNPVADISWQSDLFSAFGRAVIDLPRPVSVPRLLWVYFHWLPIAWRFKRRSDSFNYLQSLAAAQCETVGANLIGFSRIPLLGGGRKMRAAGFAYTNNAFIRSSSEEAGGPVHALAAITIAKYFKSPGSARPFLERAQERVAGITDVNQRARVYRGIAELIIGVHGRKYPSIGQAREALFAADGIPGIGEDVRAKNLAVRRSLRI